VCVDSANLPDGTSCIAGGTCQSGICKRTVSGTFQTTFWVDDGTKTTVNALPRTLLNGLAGTPSALLVPDSNSSGYSRRPFAVDGNLSFTVSDVPASSYFLELDRTEFYPATCGASTDIVEVVRPLLVELSASTPDLGSVTAARPDLVPAGSPLPQITFDISGMDAWAASDEIRIASSQALASQGTFPTFSPDVGAMTFSGTTQWIGDGLADASKGDVVFVYQRTKTDIGSGANAASLRRTIRFSRLTGLTLSDGTTASATATLVAASQTGSIHPNVANAQCLAVAADVHTEAVPAGFGLGVAAIPHSVQYPDMPLDLPTPVLGVTPASPVDADYGQITYGQFLDPLWKEYVNVGCGFRVPSEQASAILNSSLPMSALGTTPIAPVVGPPKSPRIDGKNAFVRQLGVGVQPRISWSAPAIGAPTSYVVEIGAAALPCASGQTVGVSAVIHSGTSFKVPPDILRTGIGYRAVITARQAPWDTPDAGPFRTGTPLHTAQTVTSLFVP
jgi:hypothetical protein